MAVVIRDEHGPAVDWAQHGRDQVITWSQPPQRDEVRAAIALIGANESSDDADGVVVSGTISTLHHVVEGLHRAGRSMTTPVGYVPLDDNQPFVLSRGLNADIDLACHGPARRTLLVRDEQGGVVLDRAELLPAGGAKTLGAQAYHDDHRICDGPIKSITVTPDYAADDPTIDVVLRPTGPRRRSSSRGRSIQIACDEAITVVDGIASSRTLTKRTWYGDWRTHWLLRC